ncbi:hypothetical protein H4O09_10115 [Stenotrophomonas sp. W1S232]|uniref:Uncharacterized protein n=1 Tax=Stenotrophomonas koreensis TaxID=266128 RepID=A0A7W3V1R9_9GAMM|nr:hypothetical protein [Stenotrophomonas koreensis]MBB1117402.1 hypothetical protein [Stenotrophomonas koreensis]
MLKAIIAAILVLVIGGVSYSTYRKVLHKSASWQTQTLQLSQRCGTILADEKRTEDDVERLRRDAESLAWKSKVSGDVLTGVVRTADPYEQDVVTAGRALDACMRKL